MSAPHAPPGVFVFCYLCFLLRTAGSRAQTDRSAARLLLPGNVSAAVDDGAERGGLVAGFAQPGVFDGGLVVAAGSGQHKGGAAYRRTGLRLSAGLVSRSTGSVVGGVCAIRSRCCRVVVAGFAGWEVPKDDVRRRGECGAEILAGWEAAGVRVHFVQGTLSYLCRTVRRRITQRCAATYRRERQFAASLLLQQGGSRDQSRLDA